MRLGMIVDVGRCIGCDTCAIACKVENNLPDDVWWNRVLTVGGAEQHTPALTADRPTMWFLTVACQHCENPPCVPVCPTGATYKRDEDGVVLIDYDKCIGCGACVEACPYDGVRTRNSDEITHANPFALGNYSVQPQEPATVSKCTFCEQRLREDRLPACVEVCPARARFFGDLDDPDSEVSQLLESRESFTLHPEAGTHPSVHFIK
ncbi:4Fe-4S dicluster domain-containing protein [Actinomycetaceae bacterium MB13-C1-2]|nr:4Fe-4S dicluster domain-containing protein [Actinomycetaceae bacterium MB13-C1-2]